MSSPSSKPVSKAPAGYSGERWPVLARLPDVSQATSDAATRSQRASAAGFVEYRFDPPQSHPAKDQAYLLRREKSRKRQPANRPSPKLPKSNPFAIPALTLRERLAPLVRFAVMFTLFTIVGTLLLRSMRREPSESTSVHPPLSRDPAPVRQQLTTEPPTAEPKSSVETAINPVTLPKRDAPTAAGPSGLPRGGIKPQSEQPSSSVGPPQIVELPQLLPQVQTSSPPTPSTAEFVPSPRVSGPATMARLTGDVLPQRQAHHDDHQSRLY